MFSLQALCIQHIVDNFEKFHVALSTTKDVAFKLKFEFLQKFYSLQILNKLDIVEAKYTDFLLNKYLKILHTKWLEKCPWDDVVKKFAEIGYNIEKVLVRGEGLPWEKIICHVPNVKTIIFKKHCRDNFLYAIAKFCPKIEVLDIECSYAVSDDGIKHLCCSESDKVPCPALKKLLIYGTGIGKDGIMHLIKKLPYVEEIENFFLFRVLYSTHKSDINALDKVKPYSLTHINLRSLRNFSEITDAIKVCISVCPHLKHFSSKVFKQEDLDLCCKMSKLRELRLDCVNYSPLSINDFLILKGSKLTFLELTNFSLSVTVLAQKCPFLNILTLENIDFQSESNILLPAFLYLENISFKGMSMNYCPRTQQLIRILISSPNLKQLSFILCKMFCMEIKTQIFKCCIECNLLRINFTDSEVEPELLQDILRICSSLKALGVAGCALYPYDEVVDRLKNIACILRNRPEICSDEDY